MGLDKLTADAYLNLVPVAAAHIFQYAFGTGLHAVVQHGIVERGKILNSENSALGLNRLLSVHVSSLWLIGNRHSGFSPGDDAALQVHTFISSLSQPFGGIGRAAAAAAVKGYLPVSRHGSFHFLHEITLFLVYQDCSLNMPFSILGCSPHVQHNDARVCHECCKSWHVGILKMLLATGRQRHQHA